MMLHLTITSSAYLENVWAWVADHDMDSGPSQTQIDIYVARGVLIESQGGPVWMYGTASEHSIFYQYLIYGAKDIFMGMVQTESPYFYPNPQAPNPFTAEVGMFPGDPNFTDCPTGDEHCAAAYGLMLVGATTGSRLTSNPVSINRTANDVCCMSKRVVTYGSTISTPLARLR
jgi:hypothetical protein